MPISNDNLNKKLYQLLKTQGFDPVPKNSKGDTTPVPDDADVFRFTFKVDDKPVGPAWVTVDSNQELKVYYDDKVMNGVNEDGGEGHIDSFTEFLKQLKQWAQRRQLGFDLENQDHLESDMAQREHVKQQEQINEGYYPMGKSASYNDSVPSVKIILQHTRQIQEGEQRFRNIARIFLENTVGERILAPTTRPGIAKVYARHLAEGGLPHDDRWNHIGSLVEEYTKMAGFVRATRGNQFNESAQQLVNEGINHYQSLRETLSKMTGHRGYNAYFESYTPALMEDETDTDTLNELFVQETMDPRIESVMPILSRLQKKVNEMSEVKSLEEWADSIISEKMVMGSGSDASSAGSYKMGEATDLTSIPEDDLDEGYGASLDDIISYLSTEKPGLDLESFLDEVYTYADASFGKEKADRMFQHEDYAEFEDWYDKYKGVSEGLGDIAKKVGGALKTGAKAVGKAIVGKDDDELLRDLKKRAGVRNPQTGKPSMAISDVEKREELDEIDVDALNQLASHAVNTLGHGGAGLAAAATGAGIGGAIAGAGKKAIDWYQNRKEKKALEKQKGVAEDLDANQKRVGQLGPTEKITKSNPTRGKLVGANESVELNEMDSEGYKGTRDDYELGKGKEVHLGPKHMMKAKDVVKKAGKELEKQLDKAHKKPVKEGQEDLDAILRIIRK